MAPRSPLYGPARRTLAAGSCGEGRPSIIPSGTMGGGSLCLVQVQHVEAASLPSLHTASARNWVSQFDWYLVYKLETGIQSLLSGGRVAMAGETKQLNFELRHIERAATAGLAMAFAVWLVILAIGIALLS